MVIRDEISSLNHITARSFEYMMCLKADENNVEWRMRYPPQENVAGPKYKLSRFQCKTERLLHNMVLKTDSQNLDVPECLLDTSVSHSTKGFTQFEKSCNRTTPGSSPHVPVTSFPPFPTRALTPTFTEDDAATAQSRVEISSPVSAFQTWTSRSLGPPEITLYRS